jgi:outer membrane receptor protein involved in Fe transport
MIGVWRDRLGLAVAAALSAGTAFAEDAAPATSEAQTATEEIVVTGSYIKGTPEDAALPVDVTTAEDMQDIGNPTITEMVRNLAYTSGNLKETNQFGSSGGSGQGTEGFASINLRGLGSARTLVLINGRRHVSSEALGVDINILPSPAIARMEVLKDGAAALYGSDAIAGVVNLITRDDFEGFEIRGSSQFIDESDGDHDAGFILGGGSDSVSYAVSGEWQHRSELRFRDRSWGIQPFAKNPQGGWTATGNPGTIFATVPAYPATGTGIIAAGKPDAQCDALGGSNQAGLCRFQYTFFDNITEEQDDYKAFGEVNVELGNGATWHTEAAYARMDMPNWKSSPSYPPQANITRDRWVAPNHPGLVAYKAANPGFFTDTAGVAAANQGAYALTRMIGVEGILGEPESNLRETEQRRFATGLEGTFADSVDYSLSVAFSERVRGVKVDDMSIEKYAFAIDGLGGPGCNPSTGVPGVGGCTYFNPFSNSIERSATNGAINPQYNAAVDNPKSLTDWLVERQATSAANELLVFDAVLNGETPIDLGAGALGWAAGFQARDESYSLKLNDVTDLNVSNCAFNNPRSVALGNVTQADFDACRNGTRPGTGPLAFLSGTVEEDTSRTIYAFFGELAIPITDTFDVQAAVRFEDYGGDVGSTVDPKFAFRWQALDFLALRGSASTTFRGPPQSFLTGVGTSLQFIAPTGTFKAVDTFGNPNLREETAVATNVGLVLDSGGLYASVDYWRFDFSDPFQTESAGQIVAAYQANLCADGQANAGTELCQGLRAHITPTGTPAAALQRVAVNVINGGDIVTSGIDAYAQYLFEDVFGGELTVGAQGTYTIEYDSEDFQDITGVKLAEGGDFVGFLNDLTAPFTPKPEVRGDAFVKYDLGQHSATFVARYVSDYEDAAPSIPTLKKIDEHVTYDAHYNVSLFEDSTLLSFSVINITDEDPPAASTDLNYDPFTHDPRGIVIEAGFKYTFMQ